jgi:hypothetical protein
VSPVLIVSFPEDVHGTALVEAIGRRSVTIVRRWLADVSRPFTWELGSGLEPGRTDTGLSAWRGIWRRPGAAGTTSVDPRYSDFAASECRDAFRGALLAHDIHWLNDPGSLWRAEHKMVQLETARRLGLAFPPTVVTSDPAVASQFCSRQPTVAKAVRYGLVATYPEPRMAWTQEVNTAASFEFAGVPVLFQRAIRAKAHLRVATVGQRSFTSQLVSDDLDWRMSPELNDRWQPLGPSEVPPGLAEDAVRLAAALGLNFTSQDWLLDKRGRPFFLEANPNGQWLFMDGSSNNRVTTAIADWLTAGEEANA